MKTNTKASRGLGDKDQRILDAAKVLFSRYGLKKTSIEEIALKAGLGKGTVYLYFKSKDEIFSVLANRLTQEYEDALTEAMKIPITPTDKLKAFIEIRVGYWDKTFRETGTTPESILEAEASPVVEALRKRYSTGHIKMISEVLEDGLKSGEFSFDNSQFTALAIYHILESLTRPWHQEVVDMTADEKISACVALLLNGILKRSQAGQSGLILSVP